MGFVVKVAANPEITTDGSTYPLSTIIFVTDIFPPAVHKMYMYPCANNSPRAPLTVLQRISIDFTHEVPDTIVFMFVFHTRKVRSYEFQSESEIDMILF